MPVDFEKSFMELVQLHEREWGTEPYPQRPSLADLLNAPIVAVWTEPLARSVAQTRLPSRFTLSVHQRLEDLDLLALAVVVAGRPNPFGNRKLLYLFIEKRPVKIVGVRLLIEKIT